ncbi:hypothetical protein EW026_g5187 [Hermanssonia centrifuga]|uniref:Uncharacterized protein n=1 Tax=Hermanssonia centrifuga TaxID=98765 RepID=A0A4S4KEW3_9APHY|nr:hypothetical protein EW026_g5187 [Hermanssonia centrifuga]
MEQILGGLRRLAHEQDDREEDSIAKDEGNDLHNLINADSLVTDDNLLGSEMRNLINEAKAPPNEVLEFIKSILKHRGVDTGSLPSPLDLRPLTLQGRTAVLDIISDASKRPPSSSDPDWMCTAFLVFISPSNGHDIAPYIETIQSYIKDKSLELPDLKEVQWLDEKHFDDMMGNIGKALQGLGGKHTFRLLNSILSWRLKRQASDFKFADIAAIEWEEYTTSASLMKMVSMLLGALDREIDRIVREQEFHWDKWTDNILKAIIGLVDALGEDFHSDAIAEVHKMLLKMTSLPELWWRLIHSIAEYPRPMYPGIILPLHVFEGNTSSTLCIPLLPAGD